MLDLEQATPAGRVRSGNRLLRTRSGRGRLTLEWLLTIVVVIAIWELLVRTGVLGGDVVAGPWGSLVGVVDLAKDSAVRSAFGKAIELIIVSFVIGSTVGILVGLVLGLSNYLYRVVYPFLVVWYSIPMLIFVPIMVVIFGIGDELKLVYGSISAVPSLVITVSAGVRAVDPNLVKTARAYGAGRRSIVSSVVLRSTVPSIMTGLWYSLEHVLLAVILAELFVSSNGIGFFLHTYSATGDVRKTYGLLLALAAASVIMASGLGRVERRATRFRRLRGGEHRK